MRAASSLPSGVRGANHRAACWRRVAEVRARVTAAGAAPEAGAAPAAENEQEEVTGRE